ncbi:DUF4334 domain-containing protein [Streptomyces lydicamycinicus]|jgi:hypothetical protein|uniref:DUF4334 domain-containing protein n=1 Tax=Streptomyces lydicamycinicus TaxID=1546107 RepID=A0A0P4RBK2_9ACTN|nr:DUF4334 domain-containing protein [Streptomyces lydicamycinicus]USA03980.1 DUF4334 domain-containing protein [Streptomyces lydicamycinicus]GAO10009.1 hypothetical protein TPA0598_06_01740 [Streptomyces lydicamycinicus]
MDADQARARIAALQAADDAVSDTGECDRLWAALETVRPEEILGTWKGTGISTGHQVEGLLAQARWYGKTFHSVDRVEPLICRDEHGALFSHTELAKGEASLWMVEFRGETTATMVYDGQPVLDHFKRAGDDTLLGVMNGKNVLDDGRHFYFLLERA